MTYGLLNEALEVRDMGRCVELMDELCDGAWSEAEAGAGMATAAAGAAEEGAGRRGEGVKAQAGAEAGTTTATATGAGVGVERGGPPAVELHPQVAAFLQMFV